MTVALRAEPSLATDVLIRKESLRAQAACDVADLTCKVAELETIMEMATAAASTAKEAARSS